MLLSKLEAIMFSPIQQYGKMREKLSIQRRRCYIPRLGFYKTIPYLCMYLIFLVNRVLTDLPAIPRQQNIMRGREEFAIMQ